MAENINFISANELPEATGDEIAVLCVENGQMKRKIGSLGGAYVIDLTGQTLDPTAAQTIITSVSYNDFADHWYKGGVLAIKTLMQGATAYMYPTGGVYMPGTGIIFMALSSTGSIGQLIFANGTWTPPAN